MLTANTKPKDNHRAALMILGFINGDEHQIRHVLDGAAQEPEGAAGLVLALSESATGYLIGLLGSEDEAAKQLSEHVMTFVSKENNE